MLVSIQTATAAPRSGPWATGSEKYPRDNPGLYFAFRVQVYLDLIILSVEINCKGKLEAVRARPGVFEDDSSKGCEPNDRFPVILFSRLLCRASKKEYQYLWPSGRGKAP